MKNPPILAEQQTALAKTTLDDRKAENIVAINLVGKSSMAEAMLIATGTSRTHVLSLAEYTMQALKEAGAQIHGVEGTENGEWVLIDTGDIIVHIFQEEARELYRLDRLWAVNFDEPTDDEQLDLTANL
ncbi:MAG: ribosome silencing factor [Magnetococcales bacterium]|nr:ribosome silencing factor [Magnetococcales bacterium]|tara:strand:+ start:260691 stop:261077 length:387 start_codon:yes stop_codon:yes gene_type:complete